ncbi:MAG: hypothetical protein ACLROI_09975 [Beduini sp.]|uniref:hypothetical protein n=1 Tax=Beduini sp. TaxID=1922300 RepID=UPI0011C9969D
MRTSKHLIEQLAADLGYEYISDLHRPQLLPEIQMLIGSYDSQSYSLKEWKDAVQYITGSSCKLCECEEIKQYLLSLKNW